MDKSISSCRFFYSAPVAFTLLLFFLPSCYLQLVQSGLQSVWSVAQNMDLPVSGRTGLGSVLSPTCETVLWLPRVQRCLCVCVWGGVKQHDGGSTARSSVFDMFKLFFTCSDWHLWNFYHEQVSISKQDEIHERKNRKCDFSDLKISEAPETSKNI